VYAPPALTFGNSEVYPQNVLIFTCFVWILSSLFPTQRSTGEAARFLKYYVYALWSEHKQRDTVVFAVKSIRQLLQKIV